MRKIETAENFLGQTWAEISRDSKVQNFGTSNHVKKFLGKNGQSFPLFLKQNVRQENSTKLGGQNWAAFSLILGPKSRKKSKNRIPPKKLGKKSLKQVKGLSL